MKSAIIRKNTLLEGKKFTWVLELENNLGEVVDRKGCMTTAKAKNILLTWGCRSRVEWTRIDRVWQGWFQ